MSIFVKEILLSKNPVNTKENLKIKVKIIEAKEEPKTYRLPIALNKPKGNINKI